MWLGWALAACQRDVVGPSVEELVLQQQGRGRRVRTDLRRVACLRIYATRVSGLDAQLDDVSFFADSRFNL